nr:MerR family transcriptional regulator [uncultured Sellimonas sp.]
MHYSIKELSALSKVSTRTLRYYDEIGLLKPLYTTDAGYRWYGEHEVDLLQQILFYKKRGFSLKQIDSILSQKDFDILTALREHLISLQRQKEHLDMLIQSVEQTILSMKGEYQMSDKEKFEAFKQEIVDENEKKFGHEIREKYGDEEMDISNRKILNMSQEDYERFLNLGNEIKESLKEAVLSSVSPESERAKRIVILHKEWLSMTWKQYSEAAHKAIATTYISDERFRLYYDKEIAGCAEFLEQSICYWVDKLN